MRALPCSHPFFQNPQILSLDNARRSAYYDSRKRYLWRGIPSVPCGANLYANGENRYDTPLGCLMQDFQGGVNDERKSENCVGSRCCCCISYRGYTCNYEFIRLCPYGFQVVRVPLYRRLHLCADLHHKSVTSSADAARSIFSFTQISSRLGTV